MKFILQRKRQFKLDLEYTLERSKEFWLWKSPQDPFLIIFEDDEKTDLTACPVGSVSFCLSQYKDKYGIIPKPKNVPEELFRFANRKINNINNLRDVKEEFVITELLMLEEFDRCYLKSNDVIKWEFNGIVDKSNVLTLSEKFDNCQVSEVINDILSEWRVFIFNGKIVGFKHYFGDPFDTLPSKTFIQEIIHNYSTAPIAYTIDIFSKQELDGSISFGIMEIHDFFSCGLYGFDKLDIYPLMLYRWFSDNILNCKNNEL